MHVVRRKAMGVLDRAIIGVLLFLVLLLLGVQIAKAAPVGEETQTGSGPMARTPSVLVAARA
jgi:hypothetical protein